jgi:biopolymer transport protein ExbD
MRLAKRHGTKLEINMTPMIDVTFLLLIFFMTVNQVSKAQREEIPLPQLKGTQDQSEEALVINVPQNGEIVVNSNVVTLTELMDIARSEVAGAGGDAGRLRVLIRANRNGNCRTVNEVVAALVRQEITHVRLAVESGQ